MIRLQLPFPPTTNTIWRNVKGRTLKSARYRTWERAAMNEALAQRQQPIEGPIKVKILLGKPDNRKRDIDNLLKAPLDLLVALGLIENDSLVQSLSISWAEVEGALVEVRPV